MLFLTSLKSHRTLFRATVGIVLVLIIFFLLGYRQNFQQVNKEHNDRDEQRLLQKDVEIEKLQHELIKTFRLVDSLKASIKEEVVYAQGDDNLPRGPIIYADCQKIPSPPPGSIWAEDVYSKDPRVTTLDVLPDPAMSRMWVEGNDHLKLNDPIRIKVQIYDTKGRLRSSGGDLVRVWIRDHANTAAASAHVVDNKDGSYSASTVAFWVGEPEVVAAIINPREVRAAMQRRRKVCPPLNINTAVFEHPLNRNISEVTTCNVTPEIPGYSELCNLTGENFGRPWYCVKPSNQRLMCNDWTTVKSLRLIHKGNERWNMTDLERDMLFNTTYQAMVLPTVKVVVETDTTDKKVFQPDVKCNKLSLSLTWQRYSPRGFMYKNQWNNRQCYIDRSRLNILECIRGKRILIIGDSTARQIFERMENWVPCKWVTDTWALSGKHRPARCMLKKNNRTVYDLMWAMHELPFLTENAPRSYMRSIGSYLNEISDNEDVILILHIHAHFNNYHSHVYYDAVKEMGKSVLKLLNRNKLVKIFIKGPHSFAFADIVTAYDCPEAYVDVHEDILFDVLKDLYSRVYYLDVKDSTVSTEQKLLHLDDNIIDEIVTETFSYVCPY